MTKEDHDKLFAFGRYFVINNSLSEENCKQRSSKKRPMQSDLKIYDGCE